MNKITILTTYNLPVRLRVAAAKQDRQAGLQLLPRRMPVRRIRRKINFR